MDFIKVKGARMHNLKNIDVEIPRGSLTVITGLSGSGKSSLAFDTIFAEGQRRYAESLSPYARQFIAQMEKPEVDNIDGLSPAISIDQKTAPRNPRSTVGTVTEIYDYMRLLWAKVGKVHCPITGKPLSKQSSSQITDLITRMPEGTKVMLLAPQVIGRKGAHQKILDTIKREGFVRMRIDGQIVTTDEEVTLDPKKSHDIEIVVDRMVIRDFEPVEESLSDGSTVSQPNPNRVRLGDSVELCLRKGDGMLFVLNADTGEIVKFSNRYVNPDYPEMSIPAIEPRSFSFNSPHGACEHCHGIGSILQIDEGSIIPNPKLTVNEGAIHPWATSAGRMSFLVQALHAVAKREKFSLDTPWNALDPAVRTIILHGHPEPVHVDFNTEKFDGHYQTTYEGVIPNLERRHRETDSAYTRQQIEAYMFELPCPSCGGKRLKKEILGVTVGGKNIVEATALSVRQAKKFFEQLIPGTDAKPESHTSVTPPSQKSQKPASSRLESHVSSLTSHVSRLESPVSPLTAYEFTIVRKVVEEIVARLTFLENVGLKYLTLDRSAATLSGGEAQRIRLATQIGSALQGVIYVLDEPSIGLHQRDNTKLIETMNNLRDIGNTVIVVEHDQETIEAADWLLEIGPGAGKHGGQVVAQGTPKELINHPHSVTGQYLSGRKKIPIPRKRRTGNGTFIEIAGATHHNLQNVTVRFPLGCFIGITGVSGSGKSSLVHGILAPELQRRLNNAHSKGENFQSITGIEHLDKTIVIDQSPIGRTPRSNPATYTGVFTEIRDVFAATPEAKLRGYKAGRFSFNVSGGRCEDCEGDGMKRIEMHFLPDVYVMCETCRGQRYNKETLEVTYKGKTIAEALSMTIAEALEFFSAFPAIRSKLQTLVDVGLGYIHLGQSATTLSGGEAQRIKLATELTKRATGRTFYVLDEPTTGLHFDDIHRLLDVLQRLVDKGNTVLVIEHNLDVVKSVDHIIDIGPDGGDGGGRVVAIGTPETVANAKESYTGHYLKKMLA